MKVRVLLSASLIATTVAGGVTTALPAMDAPPPIVAINATTSTAASGPAPVTISAIVREPIAASKSLFTMAELDATGIYRPNFTDAPTAREAINRQIGRKTLSPFALEQLKANDPTVYWSLGASEAIQNTASPLIMPSPLTTFYGQSSDDQVAVGEPRYIPPDTTGEVGPNHFVQAVNTTWGVYNKSTGARILGPQKVSALFAGTGTVCETRNDGDPIVLYDQLADRWMISQFALPNMSTTGGGPFYQCIAISTSGDPTGTWYRYAFLFSDSLMNDYPHFGMWPDGYYATFNTFNSSQSYAFTGMAVGVYERDKMLAGDPTARQVLFLLNNQPYPINYIGGGLPADLDGTTMPPAGAPNIIAAPEAAEWGLYPSDRIHFFKAHVDWTNTANSTLTGPVDVNTAGWAGVCDNTRACVPQLGSSANVDAIADRFMHRLAYRNFGSYQSLVANHTVNDGAGRAAVRWYEIRDPHASTPTLYQQSTYAPGDGIYRWMGSAAQDARGNLAIGFSGSSASQYPDIRYAGRLKEDALNTLGQGEAVLIAGGGSQTSTYNRWGDYSQLSIDPSDDCTFWYTTELYRSTSTNAWSTGIGSFRFPSCSTPLNSAVRGAVTDLGAGVPVSGALVIATSGPNLTLSAVADASGTYTIALAAGVYTVTASAYGYLQRVVPGIVVTDGVTVTTDIALTAAPTYVISGFVTDAGSGNPLAAVITATGSPFAAQIGANTDPATGFYSLTAPGGGQSWTVAAVSAGHGPKAASTGVLSGNQTISFQLQTFSTYSCGGILSEGDPTYNRVVAGNPPTGLSAYGTAVYYRPIRFTVSSTGVYSIVMASNLDGFYTLYQNSFSLSSPLANALEATDDINGINPAIYRTLTAGTTYVLIAAAYGNGDTGTFTDTISGYGNINATCGFGQVAGAVKDINTSLPVSGALVIAAGSATPKLTAMTNAAGVYTRTLPAGEYTVTASAGGYLMSVAPGLLITDSPTTAVSNFQLRVPSSRAWLPSASR